MKLDPRTKMVMAICLSSLALLYDTPDRLLLLLAATVALLLLFRFNPGAVWGYLKPFLSLMLFLFVIQSIFSPGGAVLLAAGPVPLVTSQGLSTGASVVLRIMVVTASAMLFTTFSSRDFILGLVQWKVPYELAFMVAIAIRFLPVFRDEMINVVTAVQLRGVELKKVPWGKKTAMYRRLFFPIVFGAMLKAQQLAVAMEARGFRAYPRRTYLRRLDLRRADYMSMLLFLSATLTLMGADVMVK
ncbi:MAG TPA: energy-coupling factor transporter transmembrane protein EcfT [Pelotomaculum sp.]|nr:energy-coupling factor transporter transmembrane protein EcfT [Pelotomaculum sp.]